MRWTTMTLAGILKACSARREELCKLGDAIIKAAASVTLRDSLVANIPWVHHFPSPRRGPVGCATKRSSRDDCYLMHYYSKGFQCVLGRYDPLSQQLWFMYLAIANRVIYLTSIENRGILPSFLNLIAGVSRAWTCTS